MLRIPLVLIWANLAGGAAFADDAAQPLLNCVEPRDYADHQAQVGIVFPAFSNGTAAGDVITTAVLRDAGRSRFRGYATARKPGGGQFTRGLGSGLAYPTPRPMQGESHIAAIALARLNSMQGTVWGSVSPYAVRDVFDGYVVDSTFSYAGSYEDFRADPLEVWKVVAGERTSEVSVPSEFAQLPAYFVRRATYDSFKGGALCYQLEGDGDCLGPERLTRVREVSPAAGTLVVSPFDDLDKRYVAHAPSELFAPAATVAYFTMFVAYARGDWELTVSQAEEVIASPDAELALQVDAHLYAGAAQYRFGRDGSKHLAAAREKSPFSPIVAQYLITEALFLLKCEKLDIASFKSVVDRERQYVPEEWLRGLGAPIRS
jgi:hypothetical protein